MAFEPSALPLVAIHREEAVRLFLPLQIVRFLASTARRFKSTNIKVGVQGVGLRHLASALA